MWGHTAAGRPLSAAHYPTIAAHREHFGAKRLILTHMSREMRAHADQVAEECAHDGLVIEF
jgi:phosphoribosyl 1,2-cyclic phosphodiesterase